MANKLDAPYMIYTDNFNPRKGAAVSDIDRLRLIVCSLHI
jgi:hypothetical protein